MFDCGSISTLYKYLELGTTFDDPYLKAELRVVLTCGF
jgi:hypothetical protein